MAKNNSSLSLFPEDFLLKKFEEINDYIYANEGLTPQQTLNEFLKILFIKILDEKENLGLFNISKDEFRDLNVTLQNSPAIIRINQLFETSKKEFPDIFLSEDKLKLSALTLGYIINKLQSINFQESESDAKGLAFQKFLSHSEKVGKGQFFTPQPVIDFCVKMISPNPTDIIIDPCCGSGGFLYSAFKFMSDDADQTIRKKLIEENIFGIDINRDISLITRMKLLLEENVNNNIITLNSLSDIDTLKLLLSNKEDFQGFDVVLTNPPFGTSGKITDPNILKTFELGHKWISNSKNEFICSNDLHNGQPTEILFIERCLDLLKDKGKMAIVLPNGHFENPSLEYLRYYISKKAKILAIVNLPQETFIPYGTGVKTSILFLQKENNIPEEYDIFFGRVNKLGYQGNKNGTPLYKKDFNGNPLIESGKYVIAEDFSVIISDYNSFLEKKFKQTENSYVLSSKNLKGRWDFDFYSPKMMDSLKKLNENSVRLGDIVTIVKKKSDKLKIKDSIVEYVELSDINTHSYEIINTSSLQVHELPSRASFELKKGDIITGIAGNSVGTKKHATAFVTSEHDGAICTNGFRVLRDPKINPYYLIYFLHSDMFLTQMKMFRTGAAIPNVSDVDLQNIRVYLPDDNKIEEIGDKIKKTFELRYESKKILETIRLD